MRTLPTIAILVSVLGIPFVHSSSDNESPALIVGYSIPLGYKTKTNVKDHVYALEPGVHIGVSFPILSIAQFRFGNEIVRGSYPLYKGFNCILTYVDVYGEYGLHYKNSLDISPKISWGYNFEWIQEEAYTCDHIPYFYMRLHYPLVMIGSAIEYTTSNGFRITLEATYAHGFIRSSQFRFEKSKNRHWLSVNLRVSFIFGRLATQH